MLAAVGFSKERLLYVIRRGQKEKAGTAICI